MTRQIALIKRILRQRFSAGGYFGLHLTIGILLLIVASGLFADIAEDVVMAEAITLTDVQMANWFHSHATPGLTRVMLTITNLHGTVAIAFYSTLMALWLIRKKDWHWLLTLLASVPGGMLLNVLMKQVFQRARPVFDQPLLTLSSYSFPSGHTAASTMFYGVLAAYLACHLKPWRWGIALVAALSAAMMVALVGLSRMYLGVHYLSDVLAAVVEGIAWLALCLTIAASGRKHRTGFAHGDNTEGADHE